MNGLRLVCGLLGGLLFAILGVHGLADAYMMATHIYRVDTISVALSAGFVLLSFICLLFLPAKAHRGNALILTAVFLCLVALLFTRVSMSAGLLGKGIDLSDAQKQIFEMDELRDRIFAGAYWLYTVVLLAIGIRLKMVDKQPE